MSLYFLTYLIILFCTTLLAIFVSLLSFRRRKAPGAMPLAIMMGAVSWWAFAQAMVYLQNDFGFMMFWANMRYFAISIIPFLWWLLAIEFYKKSTIINKGLAITLFSFSLLEIILVWTNNYHYLFYSNTAIIDTPYGKVLELGNGIFFYLYFIFNYFMIFWGIGLFIASFVKSNRTYKKQAGVMILGVLIPLIINSLFVFNLLPVQNIDLTPVTFAITGLVFSYGLFKVGLMDVIPIARDEVIENMDDIVIVLDNKLRLLDMNPKAKSQFENILGQSMIDDAYGKPFEKVISIWPELLNTIVSNHIVNEKISFNVGEEVTQFYLKILPIHDRNNEISGKLIVMRDITELEQALEEAKESKKQADLANSFKSRFLANMSHEIRTPMNAVIGISDLLYNEETNNEKKDKLRTILSSAESLLSIINDILDYSKIEAGKMQLEHIPYSLAETARDSIEMFRVNALRKGLNIRLSVSSNIPKKVMGDPVRLRQILVNLIGNALKFTSFGHVQLNIDVELKNEVEFIKISVADTGVGIDGERINQLFESFNQLDTSTTRKYGGTGLGLSIVKNLVDIMGGSIDVKSRIGIGTTFEVFLPMEACEEAKEKTPIEIIFEGKNKNIALSKLRILIVEDNKINQELIKTYLKNKDIKFEVADNGVEAIDKIKSTKFDIVLMDIQMPVMDGFEATNRIRSMDCENCSNLVIIALTANAMQGDKEKCIEVGMDNYLSKPVRAKELFTMLEKYVN